MQGNKIARDNRRIYPVGCLKCLDGLNVWPGSATNHVNTRQVNSDFLQKRLGPNRQVDSMPQRRPIQLVQWKTRSAKCGVWKMRGVENAECGKCGVCKRRGVENAECGKCVEHFNFPFKYEINK